MECPRSLDETTLDTSETFHYEALREETEPVNKLRDNFRHNPTNPENGLEYLVGKIMSNPARLKCDCNSCHTHTIHDVLFEKKDKGTENFNDEFSIDWETDWRVIQCRGCESISMRRDSSHSENTDEQGRPITTTTYFPPRTFRELPKWFKEPYFIEGCSTEIDGLMKELYVCLQNDCRASSAMLARAIFEHMMIDKTGDQGSFSKNLDAFERAGFVGKKQREVIESMLEAGHASIHRAFIPKKSDMITVVAILEGIMEVVYVQAPKADELKQRIPKRK